MMTSHQLLCHPATSETWGENTVSAQNRVLKLYLHDVLSPNVETERVEYFSYDIFRFTQLESRCDFHFSFLKLSLFFFIPFLSVYEPFVPIV